MSIKFNFESEEEMINYLTNSVEVDTEPDYYNATNIIVKLDGIVIGSGYVGGHHCTCNNDY